jgi:hypothetical protein
MIAARLPKGSLEERPVATAVNPKPKATVFYSWQSDLPNSTNRGLILDALERAAKKIRRDDSVAVEPVVDRDTQNVPGAPDIAHTIFQKIEKADAFVADVSIINPGLGRPTPNPNVLIELGYALKTLGNARTILVANTASGPIEALPFDLRTKRVLGYQLGTGADDKPDQRQKLQDGLEAALRAILAEGPSQLPPPAPSAADKAVESIEKGEPSQAALCTRFMSGLADRVKELTPKLDRERTDQWDDDLVEAIRQTLPLVTDFARVADAAAIRTSSDAALGLFRGFAPLFGQYNLAPGFSGHFYQVQFDLPKFIGHELMVILFAGFIAERRWEAVTKLCGAPVTIPNAMSRFAEHTPVTYLYASEHVALLDHRNERLQLRRVSLHADILKERHENGPLAELVPWRRFQEADVFLYLRSAFELAQMDLWKVWRPWSAVLLRGCPSYLLEATRVQKAQELLGPLGVKSIVELRTKLNERVGGLQQIFGSRNPFYFPFEGLRPELIGTQ